MGKFKEAADVNKRRYDYIINTYDSLKEEEKHSSSSSSFVVEQMKEVESLIKDYKLKPEKELEYICDNIRNINTKKAFEDFLADFIRGHVLEHNNNHLSVQGDLEKKETIKGKTPQLTQLQQNQQKDVEVKACLAKLRKEARDYRETAVFIARFSRKEDVIDEELDNCLTSAYREVMGVHSDSLNVAITKEDEEKLCHDNVSLIIRDFRSKVESELLNICKNASDHAVKKAFLQLLAEFKKGFKPNEYIQNLLPRLQNEDGKIMSSKPKMSAKQKKKKSKLRKKREPEGFESSNQKISQEVDGFFHVPNHDHSKCCPERGQWDDPTDYMYFSPEEEEEPEYPDLKRLSDLLTRKKKNPSIQI